MPDLDGEHLRLSLEWLKNEFKADAPKWGYQQIDVWKRFADWMFQKRIILVGITATDAFTNEFLP